VVCKPKKVGFHPGPASGSTRRVCQDKRKETRWGLISHKSYWHGWLPGAATDPPGDPRGRWVAVLPAPAQTVPKPPPAPPSPARGADSPWPPLTPAPRWATSPAWGPAVGGVFGKLHFPLAYDKLSQPPHPRGITHVHPACLGPFRRGSCNSRRNESPTKVLGQVGDIFLHRASQPTETQPQRFLFHTTLKKQLSGLLSAPRYQKPTPNQVYHWSAEQRKTP